MVLSYKAIVTFYSGVIGGFLLTIFGGWSEAMNCLLVFMTIDVITGVAGAVLQKSKKTETGGLSSKSMTAGLIRKGVILLVIIVSAQIDVLLGVDYVKNLSVIAFCINEIISIFENVGIAGVKLPVFLNNSIDLLNKKYNITGSNHENGG